MHSSRALWHANSGLIFEGCAERAVLMLDMIGDLEEHELYA